MSLIIETLSSSGGETAKPSRADRVCAGPRNAVGLIRRQTVIDTDPKVVFAMLCDRKTPITSFEDIPLAPSHLRDRGRGKSGDTNTRWPSILISTWRR